MNLTLFKVTDSDMTINKTLVDGLRIPINLKADVNIVNPTIKLMSIPGVNFLDFNYAIIDVLKRKYFISSINSLNARVWELELKCDVIETYKVDILLSKARFKRRIKPGDYLPPDLELSVNSTVLNYPSNKGFDGTPTMILTTVGK